MNFNSDMHQAGALSWQEPGFRKRPVASLEFPAEAVTRYLALEYAQRLLNTWFLSPAGQRGDGQEGMARVCTGHGLDTAEAFRDLRKEFSQADKNSHRHLSLR